MADIFENNKSTWTKLPKRSQRHDDDKDKIAQTSTMPQRKRVANGGPGESVTFIEPEGEESVPNIVRSDFSLHDYSDNDDTTTVQRPVSTYVVCPPSHDKPLRMVPSINCRQSVMEDESSHYCDDGIYEVGLERFVTRPTTLNIGVQDDPSSFTPQTISSICESQNGTSNGDHRSTVGLIADFFSLRARWSSMKDKIRSSISGNNQNSQTDLSPMRPMVPEITMTSVESDPPPAFVEDGSESLLKFSHRISWLVALLFVQSISSVILKRFSVLVVEHSAVVFFLTMLVGAGGNAGSQSTVLAIRAIAKGELKTSYDASAFILDQIWIGLKLAVVLAVVSFLRVWLFNGNLVEVLAICASMFTIVMTSVVLGTLMPLGLRKVRMDPAHAGAAIQVIMDIIGVSVTCLISTALLGWLLRAYVPMSPTVRPGFLAAHPQQPNLTHAAGQL